MYINFYTETGVEIFVWIQQAKHTQAMESSDTPNSLQNCDDLTTSTYRITMIQGSTYCTPLEALTVLVDIQSGQKDRSLDVDLDIWSTCTK